jgi:hypothetical protein
MKLIVSTAAALLLAGQAFAGNLVFEAPPEQEIVVAEPAAPMGGSRAAAWIIPAIGLAAVAWALANDDDNDQTEDLLGVGDGGLLN